MSRGLVDIHSHLFPRWYIELLKQRTEIPRIVGRSGEERFVIFPSEADPQSTPADTGEPDAAVDRRATPAGGRPMDESYWSIAAKLAFMDRFGIERTVLSLGNPWLDPLPDDRGLELARRANSEFAALERETHGRIVGMGVLPPGDPAQAAMVVDEIAQTPTLHGVVIGTRPCGVTLDDPSLEQVWEVLDRTSLPVLVHPHYGSAMNELAGLGHAGPVAIAFPVETTIALVRLVLAGVLARHPNIRLVASHAGGVLPYLAGRLDAAWRSDPSARSRLAHPPSDDLARLFVDAIAYRQGALRAAVDLVGVDRIAFGTDHPFSVADPVRNLKAIAEAFDGNERDLVAGRCAENLFSLGPWPA